MAYEVEQTDSKQRGALTLFSTVSFKSFPDLVAIPDFQSGAMENWGLITFRETTLLFDNNASSARDKKLITAVIAHELAHQVDFRGHYLDVVGFSSGIQWRYT